MTSWISKGSSIVFQTVATKMNPRTNVPSLENIPSLNTLKSSHLKSEVLHETFAKHIDHFQGLIFLQILSCLNPIESQLRFYIVTSVANMWMSSAMTRGDIQIKLYLLTGGIVIQTESARSTLNWTWWRGADEDQSEHGNDEDRHF